MFDKQKIVKYLPEVNRQLINYSDDNLYALIDICFVLPKYKVMVVAKHCYSVFCVALSYIKLVNMMNHMDSIPRCIIKFDNGSVMSFVHVNNIFLGKRANSVIVDDGVDKEYITSVLEPCLMEYTQENLTN